MSFPQLAGLFSGYLHQDWDLEYPDATGAISDFISSETVETVQAALAQLVVLLAMPLDDEELRLWLLDVGCYYLPSGSTRVWLVTVADQLRESSEGNCADER